MKLDVFDRDRGVIGRRVVWLFVLLLVAPALAGGCRTNDGPEVSAVPAQEQSMIVDDARVYRELFQQLQRATFVREGLESR